MDPKDEAKAMRKWWRYVGAVALMAALAALTGCRAEAEAPEVQWRSDYEAALAEAKAAGKPAVIEFTASWCAQCQQLKRETLEAPEVRRALQGFVAIRLDGTASVEAIEAWMTRHAVEAFPAVVFVSSRGEVLAAPRVEGPLSPAAFVALLQEVD